jgi:hypothetical protein
VILNEELEPALLGFFKFFTETEKKLEKMSFKTLIFTPSEDLEQVVVFCENKQDVGSINEISSGKRIKTKPELGIGFLFLMLKEKSEISFI